MKVVIDTNVVVSSLLRNGKPRRVIERVLSDARIERIITEDIQAEYEEVISRARFRIPLEVIQGWVRIFELLTRIDDAGTAFDFPRDPKDERFGRCCIASDANYFITGDGDFRGVDKIKNTAIISASNFLALFESTSFS